MDGFEARRPMVQVDDSASTRQKSCNTCVRGKRRCDKRTPRCTRCAAKDVECVYRGQASAVPSSTLELSFDMFPLGLLDMDLASTSVKLDGPAPPPRDVSLLKTSECGFPDPEQVYDPRSRIGYVLSEFTALHEGFAQHRATAFMHARLYACHLPPAMTACFAAAGAYAGRGRGEARGWAVKAVQQAVRDVYREGGVAGTTTEKLARLQALLVLNSIRVFDGDLAMRAGAEEEMGVMLAWTRELKSVKDELEDGGRLPKTWEAWILLESTRRTILATYAVTCLIFLLKHADPPTFLWRDDTSFTASRHLWEAGSSVEFYRAWREKPQWRITNMDFTEFWKYARAEDMDEFTRVMLTPQIGVDAMEHFIQGDTTIPV